MGNIRVTMIPNAIGAFRTVLKGTEKRLGE